MNIVPFKDDSALPAYLQSAAVNPSINKDVVRAAAFPNMSIKGKVFTIVKDGVKKLLTKPDEPDEVAQSIGVVVLRANMASHVLYLAKFADGTSDGQRPDCYSYDGVAPSPNSPNPQSKKCAVCPHRVWGSRIGDGDQDGGERKGRACSDNARLAIAAPDTLDQPMLLRVPPASLKNWRDAVKILDARKIPYNAAIIKISFDPEKPSPTLKFKPVGLLGEPDFNAANAAYDSELVRAIAGVDDHGQEAALVEPAPPVSGDELDAAIAARDASSKAAAPAPVPTQAPAPAPTAAPTPAPTAAPVKRAKAAPKVEAADVEQAIGGQAAAPAPAAPPADSGMGSLLADIDSLLGGKDD